MVVASNICSLQEAAALGQHQPKEKTSNQGKKLPKEFLPVDYHEYLMCGKNKAYYIYFKLFTAELTSTFSVLDSECKKGSGSKNCLQVPFK